jgi:hypothetical protein
VGLPDLLLSTDANPTCVIVRDINSDGKQDILVSNFNGGTISVFAGNGTGSFTLSSTLFTGLTPNGIAAGEFNNDGRIDIVVLDLVPTSLSPGQLWVYYGIHQEINVTGNNINIPDDTTAVSQTTGSDFGNVNLCSQITRNFTIQNTGGIQLQINDINFTGIDAAMFTVSGITLPKIIPAGSSAVFTITFNPTTTGIKNAIVHISNNDCDEGDYDFVIQGTTQASGPDFTSCPGNQCVTASMGLCKSTVNYNIAATLNPAYSYSFTGATNENGAGTGSGSEFFEGITHVIITATSSCGISTCSFDITILANTNDNNACTMDACNTVSGIISNILINIDDNNICTNDECNSITGISHVLIDVDEHDACTTDACNSLTGVLHFPVIINDENVCTEDACNSFQGVSHNYIYTDDNDACTTDGCNSITGIFHTPVNTDDGNICTTDGCNSITGIFHIPISTDDGNACTTDGCNSAIGIFHNPVDIDDNNICTTDACDTSTGAVSNTPVNTDDGNACTTDDCHSLTGPFHTPVNTDDNNVCTADACDTSTGTVTHTTLNTDDGNACTTDDCDSVTGQSHASVNTDDNNNCTIDVCDTQTGIITHTDDSPAVTIVAGTIACNGGTTCVTLYATGGQAPYSGTSEFCGYGMGTYSFDVIDNKGCTVSETITISEPSKLLLSTTSTPSSGTDGTATANPTEGTTPYTYMWSDGQSTPTANGLAPGNYCITITDANGCTASSCVEVTSSCVLNPPEPISGPDGACKKQSGIVLCATPDAFASSYIWTLPAGVTMQGLSTGPCITVKFSTKFQGGFFCVKAVTACGITAYACKNVVLITTKPSTPGLISGPTSLCPNQIATYTIAPVPTASNYTWSEDHLTILSGQGTTSVTVKADANFTNGKVKVKAINCKDKSGERSRNIAKTLVCRVSANAIMTNSDNMIESLSAYPNPTSSSVKVTFISDRNDKYILKLVDMIGKVLIYESLPAAEGYNSKDINLENVAKGVYMIYVQTEDGKAQTLRLIVE